ncbi:MAG: DMT family transporter [Clostridia bacterium]|nr:DMT family transporter [Clostridia bacterium]
MGKKPVMSIFSNTYVLMTILLLFWGSFSAVTKLVLYDLDSFQLQFYMFGIAMIVLCIVMIVKKMWYAIPSMGWKRCSKLILLALPQFFYYFLYVLALERIPAIEASMLNYLFPVFIVLLSLPFSREKICLKKWISILTGFTGVILVITGGRMEGLRFSDLGGDFMAVGAALSWAVFSIMSKINKEDLLISCFFYTGVTFFLDLFAMIIFSKFVFPGMLALTGCAWLCISNILLTYAIWFHLLKTTSSSKVAALSFVTPFITLVFIAIFIGEPISSVSIVGVSLIIAGNLAVAHTTNKYGTSEK